MSFHVSLLLGFVFNAYIECGICIECRTMWRSGASEDEI